MKGSTPVKITLLQTISGMRDGEEWPPRGSVVDFPDDEAASLIAAGIAAEGAVELTGPGSVTGASLEAAVVSDEGVETADAAPAPKTRGRKAPVEA